MKISFSKELEDHMDVWSGHELGESQFHETQKTTDFHETNFLSSDCNLFEITGDPAKGKALSQIPSMGQRNG